MTPLNKAYFYDYDLQDWQAWCQHKGLPRYRAGQILAWSKQGPQSFAEFTNLSKELRAMLAEEFYLSEFKIYQRLVSSEDDLSKYLFQLADRNIIETVYMGYNYGASVCISSQVGCRMACDFCASAPLGLVRNLTSGEMLAQVIKVNKTESRRVSNIVIMGIGEPLDNFEEVVKFIRQVNDPAGLNISMRKISLSTCGLIPGIKRLAQEELPITLALSLHAPNQALREQLMPIAKSYPLEEILAAVDDYYRQTGRRISYEYALFSEVNDSLTHAKQLADLVKQHPGHVNLIPANTVEGKTYTRTFDRALKSFHAYLLAHGVNATIRKSLGNDVMAACGQLRRDNIS